MKLLSFRLHLLAGLGYVVSLKADNTSRPLEDVHDHLECQDETEHNDKSQPQQIGLEAGHVSLHEEEHGACFCTWDRDLEHSFVVVVKSHKPVFLLVFAFVRSGLHACGRLELKPVAAEVKHKTGEEEDREIWVKGTKGHVNCGVRGTVAHHVKSRSKS